MQFEATVTLRLLANFGNWQSFHVRDQKLLLESFKSNFAYVDDNNGNRACKCSEIGHQWRWATNEWATNEIGHQWVSSILEFQSFISETLFRFQYSLSVISVVNVGSKPYWCEANRPFVSRRMIGATQQYIEKHISEGPTYCRGIKASRKKSRNELRYWGHKLQLPAEFLKK